MPYQLIMVKASDPDPQTGEVQYTELPMRFTLPIPPQELTNEMAIATTLQATLTGVSAQHGGAPFRDISLSGTTGINPSKIRTDERRNVVAAAAESIFAGTIQNALLAQQSAQQAILGGSFQNNFYQGITEGDADEPDRIDRTSTGFYQMQLMERFIESYIALKTDGPGVLVSSKDSQADATLRDLDPRKVRLAFCIWREEAIYLVEPMRFSKRRSAQSPMEYMFTLQLRAYKRIRFERAPETSAHHQFAGRRPSIIAEIFNRVRAARRLLTNLNDSIESMISDPANVVGEAIRETSLFLAEISGVKASLAELPTNITDEMIPAIRSDWATLRTRYLAAISPSVDAALLQTNGLAQLKQPLDQDIKDELYTNVFPNLKPDQLRLSPTTRTKINNEIERVKKFGRYDFEKARDLVLKASADFADRAGAGSVTYAEVYGREVPTVFTTPTSTTMDVIFAFNEMAINLDRLAVSSKIDPPAPTSLEYIAGLAEASGIAFTTPRSKLAVPFPYGFTLERLSALYLGDPNRWHEIVALNGLRTPYVDEEGFQLSLLVNGDGNIVVVNDRKNLYIGQTVWLAANAVRREKRHIVNITEVTAQEYEVTLDGAADLERFTVSDQAVLEAFLPATVNSQQSIYIPSQNEAPDDPLTKQIPGVDEFDALLQVSGVDLLLTPDGDLAITPDGDCRLAYGLANIVQTVKLALSTPKGALLQHPEYGLEIVAGTSTADINADSILQSVEQMFNRDPMFSGVRSAFVAKNGSTLTITLDVGIAGTSSFIPITVAIKST